MKWYIDRLLIWILAILVSIIILPFRLGGLLFIYIGNKFNHIDELILNTKFINWVNTFVNIHQVESNDRNKNNTEKNKGFKMKNIDREF